MHCLHCSMGWGGWKLAPAPRWPRASAERAEIAYRAASQRTRAALRQPHRAAALGGRQPPGAETLDNFARTLDQRTVARMHAAIEPQIVLQANAHMPAEQHRLREHRHLHAPDAEAGPVRARRQVVNHGLHRASVCRGTPGNTEAQLKQWWIVEQTFLEQLLG